MSDVNPSEPCEIVHLPFFIERVVIINFKRFQHLDVTFSRGMNILVGDNGSGKTTVLEAIDLALTGRYRGESINRCLSEHFFNNDVVNAYLERVREKKSSELPPAITIELFLGGGNPRDVATFSGGQNSTRCNACGLAFRIELDEDYSEEYATLVNEGGLSGLPIEYYAAKAWSFADCPVGPRQMPVKVALVNPSSDLYGYRSESRATRTLYDTLDNRMGVKLAQEYRAALKCFECSDTIEQVNCTLDSEQYFGEHVALEVDSGTRDSWKEDLIVSVSNVPYQHIGSGMQCKLVSGVAMAQTASKGIGILLIEEPENHLSHSQLNAYLDFLEEHADDRQLIVTTHSSFVANKLGLDTITLLGGSERGGAAHLTSVDASTRDYFSRLPGFDTLRFVLCKTAVLVEGPSDELVFQRAYRDSHDGKLPIQNGIDVISIGTSFQRYLPIACEIGLRVVVITDNDDNPETLDERYSSYLSAENIEVCYESKAHGVPEGGNPDLRWNTLEATLLRENGIDKLDQVLGVNFNDWSSLLKWMESNKTDAAFRLFSSDTPIAYPEYIKKALAFVDLS